MGKRILWYFCALVTFSWAIVGAAVSTWQPMMDEPMFAKAIVGMTIGAIILYAITGDR